MNSYQVEQWSYEWTKARERQQPSSSSTPGLLVTSVDAENRPGAYFLTEKLLIYHYMIISYDAILAMFAMSIKKIIVHLKMKNCA